MLLCLEEVPYKQKTTHFRFGGNGWYVGIIPFTNKIEGEVIPDFQYSIRNHVCNQYKAFFVCFGRFLGNRFFVADQSIASQLLEDFVCCIAASLLHSV